MVWSSAASSSASITPMVARTLMRGVSSACGMGFSLLDAHRLDEAQTQMAELNQLRLVEATGQRDLGTRGLPPQCLDALAALLGELGIDGPTIGGIVHAFDQAVALQVVDEAGHRSRGNVQHLRQLAHGETSVRLVLQAHQDLEAALTEAEPIRPACQGGRALLPQDRDAGQGLRSGLDFSALSLQNFTDPRVEQEAIRVGLELGGVMIGLESELTHIYRAHYHIAQETTQPAIDGDPVTGWAGAARRRPPFLRDRGSFLVGLVPYHGLGARGASAYSDDADGGDEYDDDRQGHARPHAINERLREDGMGQPLQLLRDLRRDTGGQLQAPARLAAPDLKTLARRPAGAIAGASPKRGLSR